MQLGAAPVNPVAGMTKGAQKSARFGSKFWGKPEGGNRNLWTNWREHRKGETRSKLPLLLNITNNTQRTRNQNDMQIDR
jgi:hypothetical protein